MSVSMNELAMLVPSRARPSSVDRMADAWHRTGDPGADLVWLLDRDDPELEAYRERLVQYSWMKVAIQDRWTPMVPKLDAGARLAAEKYPFVGFIGDDHLPRTPEFGYSLSKYLHAAQPAIVYGADGFQDQKLPTWWTMSSDIIKALGRMVPAQVQHLYCDNAIMRLGEVAGMLHYLPHVLIEHMHPAAGKGSMDEGYLRVNRREQYMRDQALYRTWLNEDLERDATLLRRLRGV